MKRFSITEAKNRLSALLEYVRQGETVVIEERGLPIAQLRPVNGTPADSDADKIARLMRAGVVQPAERDPRVVMEELLRRSPIETSESVVGALLEERRQSR